MQPSFRPSYEVSLQGMVDWMRIAVEGTMRHKLARFLVTLAFSCVLAAHGFAAPSHAIAMHGAPALPADFDHLPYANPSAPKGGRINYAWPGTFDSVNPFIVQGSAARGTVDLIFGDLVFDRLMLQSADEPFTMYPLLARTVETDDERSFVEFTLDERAKFSDGRPVTQDDVIFSFEILRDKGVAIEYSDPNVPVFPRMREHKFNLKSVDLTPEIVASYDCVVLLTDHSKFDYDMIREHARLVVDTRGKFREGFDTLVKA